MQNWRMHPMSCVGVSFLSMQEVEFILELCTWVFGWIDNHTSNATIPNSLGLCSPPCTIIDYTAHRNLKTMKPFYHWLASYNPIDEVVPGDRVATIFSSSLWLMYASFVKDNEFLQFFDHVSYSWSCLLLKVGYVESSDE